MKKLDDRLRQLLENAKEEFSDDNFIVAIPIFYAKKFIAYCAMKEDLKLCLQYIEKLKEQSDNVIKSSLTYALISLYGKCFTDASKNNYPKLEPNKIFTENKEIEETHNFLMDLRHQFIAHRGKTDSEVGVSFLIIPKQGDIEKTQIRFSQLKQQSFSDGEIAKIEALLKFVIKHIEEKIEKSAQKIHDGFLENFSHELISMLTINNTKTE